MPSNRAHPLGMSEICIKTQKASFAVQRQTYDNRYLWNLSKFLQFFVPARVNGNQLTVDNKYKSGSKQWLYQYFCLC